MASDKAKLALAELVALEKKTLRQIATQRLKQKQCRLCSKTDNEIYSENTEQCISSFSIACKAPRCKGTVSFEYVVVKANGGFPFRNKRVVNIECDTCNAPHSVAAEDVASEVEPETVETFDVELLKIRSVEMHEHHTQYEPVQETITVCNPCHQLIHHRDGYRDDLKPEQSRGSWEQKIATGEIDA